ncbi:amidohydrolase family protein [Chitinophaga silvisoli]|nr:amidohydrolase family protein [Chitinophaga silvisoli]
MKNYLLLAMGTIFQSCLVFAQQGSLTVLKDITLIDGSGAAVRQHANMVIQADKVISFPDTKHLPKNARRVNMNGKTVMPLLINAHGHLGLIKGNTASANNYTEENVKRQLEQYLHYGIGAVLSMGTDQPLIWPLRDSSQKGIIPGATIYTAGYGFGANGGVPPGAFGKHIQRPLTPEAATAAMEQLAALHPDFVKIWVDGNPKVTPDLYKAIIESAHAHGIKVAAHVYYLQDARDLVANGIDLLAHSIRDQEVDDAFITLMKEKGTFYIPTLSLDRYNFAYGTEVPDWINDPFFINSLEPGVYDELKNMPQKNDKDRDKKIKAFRIASANLRKLDSAGIPICMGTDSGAQPTRAQGFSEHLELQLMAEAGLSPLKVITCATANGQKLLDGAHHEGTLQPGNKADFMVLDGNPAEDIKATRSIIAIWKNGKEIK